MTQAHPTAPLHALRDAIEPEWQALLHLARVTLTDEARTALRGLFERSIDFERVQRRAAQHGLSSLVFHHLESAFAGQYPAEVRARLSRETQRNAVRCLGLCAELAALVPVLEARGIAARFVKGATLSALAYGDAGLRHYTDLDVLVSADETAAFGEVLADRGYVPHLALSQRQQRWLLESDSELMWRHPDRLRAVDVHWSLLPRGYSFTPDDDGPFRATDTVRIGLLDVPTLGMEAHLLFVLLHGMKHDFMSLGWLMDVAEFVRSQPALDWRAVAEWSAPVGRRRFVDIGLLLAHELLDAPVPAALLSRARADDRVTRYALEVAQHLFEGARRSGPFDATFGLTYFRAMPVVSDQLRHVHDMLLRPTSHEWKALWLPERLRPLYYAVRPARLALKYARRVRSRA